jgi:branched-chain amino acid transport system ATP-binding protein
MSTLSPARDRDVPSSASEPAPNAADALLELSDVSLSFAGVRALSEVSCAVARGEIFAIIGPNGAGKSSLLNVISGVYRPDSGRIVFGGEQFTRLSPNAAAQRGIARTTQNLALFRGMTVLENLLVGRTLHTRTGFFAHALRVGPALREEREQCARVDTLIEFLEISPYRDTPVRQLPYGLQKRVELGRALAAEPTLLLLDEPMAGMTFDEKLDLCRFIVEVNESLGTTVILIEHDMGVVMDISNHIMVLDYGRKIADGGPEHIRTSNVVIDAYLGVAHEA